MLIKTLIISALVSTSTASFAKQRTVDPSVMPTTATLMFSLDDSTGDNGGPAMQRVKNRLLGKVATQLTEASADVQCETVYREWTFDHGSSGCGLISGVVAFYAGGGCDKWTKVHVNVFCQARDLQQQQIGSLSKSCHISPSKECYEPAFLEYLGKLHPTQYFDSKAE